MWWTGDGGDDIGGEGGIVSGRDGDSDGGDGGGGVCMSLCQSLHISSFHQNDLAEYFYYVFLSTPRLDTI